MHESVAIAGVSEMCKYNDHELCRSPRCGCDCHQQRRVQQERVEERAQVEVVQTERVVRTNTGPMVCPQCRQRRSEDERFCRQDGTRLVSLTCIECGALYDPGDKYCYSCGGRLDVPATERVRVPAQTAPRPKATANPVPVHTPVVAGDGNQPATQPVQPAKVGKLPASAFQR